jgi:hypothetical protein
MGAMTGVEVEKCLETEASRKVALFEGKDAEARGRSRKACMGRVERTRCDGKDKKRRRLRICTVWPRLVRTIMRETAGRDVVGCLGGGPR